MTETKYNIVCISTIDWDFIWQGHQEIMSTLAQQGHRILFIENTGVRRATLRDIPRLKHRLLNWQKGVRGIRKVMENVYVYAPLVLPFPYSRIARAINKAVMFMTLRRWTKTMRFDNPIIWTWLPTALALELIRFLDGQLVVYYCCDDFQASSTGSKRIRETEDRLLREADLVFAHSKALFDRCARFTDQVHVFQYGFNREVFSHTDSKPPADLEPIPHPILGYVGGVHQHVDQVLLEKVAAAHPDKSLVLVGPIQTEIAQLSSFPNVYFLGQKPYQELPDYIKHFNICLIPYALNEYTKCVYPTKLNEYLIMGKPVVSTNLPEVAYFNQCNQGIVTLADTQESFLRKISEELTADTEDRRAQRIQLVGKNAWGEKIEAMKALIHRKLMEKEKSRELNWQDMLLGFYGASRRKVVLIAAIIALVYSVVFYTPVVWQLAEPLRAHEQVAAADVIVVLAAGIGESGQPGQAYQEKVKYGVDLYKQGYGKTLLFSSGVGNVFKEAQVMKALAVSLGVPESAIILDERGGGTYASLLNARQIMGVQGWTSMVLVTSRYNTGRSQMVVQRNLPDILVHVTSAPHSVFFGENEQVMWKHLRAIIHEYIAIIYYWAKGYI